MYPELQLGSSVYTIDYITPLLAIIIFVAIVYGITKSQQLQFRSIAPKLPVIIIMTILLGTYSNFVLQSGHLVPLSISQFQLLFSVSVDSLDFIGVVVGLTAAHIIALTSLHKKQRYKWNYILILTYLSLIIILGVLYTLGDSVIGKFNEGFFSIGSFIDQSRIAQFGGSVYPIGLALSGWALICIVLLHFFYQKFPNRGSFFVAAIFMIGYIFILPYQHYPRHLIVNIGPLLFDIRSYLCFAIACISVIFGYSVPSVHRFPLDTNENRIHETR